MEGLHCFLAPGTPRIFLLKPSFPISRAQKSLGWLAGILVGLVFLGTTGCAPPGQRLLHVQVVKDGVKLLETHYSIPDFETRRFAWSQLASQPFEPTSHWVAPLTHETTLKGSISILFDHASQPFLLVETDEITLKTEPAQPGLWKLSKEDHLRLNWKVPN